MPNDHAKQLLDDMLHPVRMRVIMALSGSQGMTPQQIAEKLSDVPQATLYRQINRLAKARIVTVVDERPVRGTLEKVYAVNFSPESVIGQEALSNLSKEDHLRYFTAFAVTLIDEFSRYLEDKDHPDLAADGVGYQQIALFMSDEELARFAQVFNQAILPSLKNEGAPDRKKRIFTTVMIPETGGNEEKRQP